MRRLGLFLLLAPFLTACIADDNHYYTSNTHYHQAPNSRVHAHAQVHGNSHYHPHPVIRHDPRYQNHANHQLHDNTQNKPSTHANSRNIPAHGHD